MSTKTLALSIYPEFEIWNQLRDALTGVVQRYGGPKRFIQKTSVFWKRGVAMHAALDYI